MPIYAHIKQRIFGCFSSMSFRAITSLTRNPSLSIKARTMAKPVQSLARIRHRCPELFNDPKCTPLCWAGVFGSFSRNQQTPKSNIDMIIGYRPQVDGPFWSQGVACERFATRAPKLFGRKVRVLPMLTQDVTSYYMLEALLTCVTVYGPEDWHDCARKKAHSTLEESHARLWKAYRIICQIENALETTNKNVIHILKFTKRRNLFPVLNTAHRFSAP